MAIESLSDIQRNSVSAFSGGGTTDPLDLSDSNPAAPGSGVVRIFGHSVSNRMMPSFIGPSGLDTAIQPFLARNKVALVTAQGNGTVVASMGLTITAAGTASTVTVSATNIHQAMRRIAYLVTTASATAVAGFRHNIAQFFRGAAGGKLGGFHFICRFGPATGNAANATRRGFCGFLSTTTAPTDVDPSTLTNVLGVGCDSADTNYFVMHRTGTGTVVKVNTGIAKSAADNTEMYDLAIFCAPGGTSVHIQFTRLSDDVSFTHTITTSLPAETTLLAPQGYYSVGGTNSVIGVALVSMYIETDY